jgi:hypothetical protein
MSQPKKRAPRNIHPDKPARKRKEQTQDHVGAPTWAEGSQFQYLQSFIGDWTITQPRSGPRKAIIRKIAILFLSKYGWEMEENPDALDPDPVKLLELDAALTDGCTDTEIELRATRLAALQTVSMLWFS